MRILIEGKGEFEISSVEEKDGIKFCFEGTIIDEIGERFKTTEDVSRDEMGEIAISIIAATGIAQRLKEEAEARGEKFIQSFDSTFEKSNGKTKIYIVFRKPIKNGETL